MCREGPTVGQDVTQHRVKTSLLLARQKMYVFTVEDNGPLSVGKARRVVKCKHNTEWRLIWSTCCMNLYSRRRFKPDKAVGNIRPL